MKESIKKVILFVIINVLLIVGYMAFAYYDRGYFAVGAEIMIPGLTLIGALIAIDERKPE